MILQGLFAKAIALFHFGQVAGVHGRLAAPLMDGVGNRFQFLLIAGHQQHSGAGIGKLVCHQGADARAGAGEQNHFAVDPLLQCFARRHGTLEMPGPVIPEPVYVRQDFGGSEFHGIGHDGLSSGSME